MNFWKHSSRNSLKVPLPPQELEPGNFFVWCQDIGVTGSPSPRKKQLGFGKAALSINPINKLIISNEIVSAEINIRPEEGDDRRIQKMTELFCS